MLLNSIWKRPNKALQFSLAIDFLFLKEFRFCGDVRFPAKLSKLYSNFQNEATQS